MIMLQKRKLFLKAKETQKLILIVRMLLYANGKMMMEGHTSMFVHIRQFILHTLHLIAMFSASAGYV